MIEKAARAATRRPKLTLIIATAALVPCIFGYLGTRVNYDITSYLPKELDSVKGEAVLGEVFGNAATAFLIVEGAPAKEVVKIKEKVSAVEGVKDAIWTDFFADPSVPASFLPDGLRKIFYSSDLNSTLIIIRFEEKASSESAARAVKEIKSIAAKQCFLSGASAVAEDTKELVGKEAPTYVAAGVALVLIALLITASSPVLPFVLLLALGYAVVYNMGTNYFLGSVSYITQSVAAVLQLGVTMDYSVFLADRYEEELLKTDDRSEAMARAASKTFVSLLSGSLTTVFGFLALCFMSFGLGTDIGVVMAKGVILGVLTVVITLPAMILTFGDFVFKFRRRPKIPNFEPLAKFSVKYGKTVALIFFALIIPSFYFARKVDVYYDVQKAAPRNTSSVKALEKLKKDFNMASTHFVIIGDDVPARRISSMTREFKKVEGISGVASLSSLVGPAIPESIIPDEITDASRKGGYRLTALSSVYEPATEESEAQLDKLGGILSKYDENGYITGEAALSSDLASLTAKDFKKTSVISAFAIFVLIALCFKSFGVSVLIAASIELAIFVNEAIAFFAGDEIPFVAPAIIGCVQLGATVDYAILAASRFKENLLCGKDGKTAAVEAAAAAGRSIFRSALAFFCATFGVRLVCEISIVKSVCALLARGAIISAAVTIVFLPALLSVGEGFINKNGTVRKKKGAEA